MILSFELIDFAPWSCFAISSESFEGLFQNSSSSSLDPPNPKGSFSFFSEGGFSLPYESLKPKVSFFFSFFGSLTLAAKFLFFAVNSLIFIFKFSIFELSSSISLD
jgi:hypothetical protein